MSEIFISYKSEEKDVARQLAVALEAAGRSVWWDRELVTGESVELVIEQAMKEARCVIVLWSKRSIESDYVNAEARFAWEEKKLFPVQIEAVKLPFLYRGVHTHNLVGWDGSASHELFVELASDLQKYCDGEGRRTRPSPGPDPGTDPDPGRWKVRVAIALAVLLLLPVAWLLARQFIDSGPGMTRDQEVALMAREHMLAEIEAGFVEQDRAARAAGTAEVPYEPGEIFPDCDGCPRMVVLPRGHFRMGSMEEADEQPVRVVAIHQRLAMGVNEVTRAQFQAFINANPDYQVDDGCLVESGGELINRPDHNWRNPGFAQDGMHPVVCVSMKDAMAYTEWLNTRVDGEPYRLPSEAEWEYAARSGKTSRYWWGDELEANKANCQRCGSAWDNRGTSPSASFPSNLFSLADTAGNVGEWVQDCKNPDYAGAPLTGEAWLTGDCTYRGVRGGRWSTNPKSLRPAARNWFLRGKRVNSIGFRVVRSLP